MDVINNLLGKYKKLLAESDDNKSKLNEIMKNNIGIELDKKQIQVKQETLYLNCPPVLKSEIFLKQSIILDDIKNNTNIKIYKIKLK